MVHKFILSIDGGGIRGQFDVEILHCIEKHTQRKIADIFDLVIGVSAGAVTAAVVASKKYKEIKEYNHFSTDAFDSKQKLGPVLEAKFDGVGKSRALKQIFGDEKIGSINFPLAILTTSLEGKPVLFSNWDKSQKDICLHKILDASTAAPVFFPPVEVEPGKFYIDGAAISNDPVLLGILTGKELFGDDVQLCVLSLGTGTNTRLIKSNQMPKFPKKFGMLRWLIEGLLDILTQPDENLFLKIVPLILGKGNYMRVTSTVVGNMDDTSETMQSGLLQNAKEVWNTHGKKILEFISSKTA